MANGPSNTQPKTVTPEGDQPLPENTTNKAVVTEGDTNVRVTDSGATFDALTEGVGEGTSVLSPEARESHATQDSRTFVTPQTYMDGGGVEPGPTLEAVSGQGNL